jgi:hypothetical protein
MLDHFRDHPNEPYKMMDTKDGEKIYKTAGMVDTEGKVTFKSIMNEEKKPKEEQTEEKPIDKIEEVKTKEEALNLEIDIDKEQQETTDEEKEIVVDTPLFVEAKTTTEETVEPVQIIAQEEVFSAPEVSNTIVEAEHIEIPVEVEKGSISPAIISNIVSVEKLATQEPVQAIEQPPVELEILTEKPEEKEMDKQITEKILDLLKDEPLAVSETPVVAEEIVKVEVTEIQIPPAETIEQIHVVQEQIAPAENKASESIKVSAPEIKTTDNTKIEAIKPEIIMRTPEASIVEPVKSIDKGVLSPYVEISTTFKAEIKNSEKEEIKEEVLITLGEKVSGDAIETPDIPANTIIDTARTEKEIHTEPEETPEEEQTVQVVQPEITEEISVEHEAVQEVPVALSEIKNEATEAIENIKPETTESIQNPTKEIEPQKIETVLKTPEEINKTEIGVSKIETPEINNEARNEKVIDLPSDSTEKIMGAVDKTEKNLPIDGHEMLLRILGLPPTKNELNRNESIQTRSTPYSAIESDSTNTKPPGSQSKVINKLNGITLQRAV